MKPQVLIAGIGNIFKGDDAFGVEVIKRMNERVKKETIQVEDFGIRGWDLAFHLLDKEYDLVILVDAVQRGRPPGTLYIIEPEKEDSFFDTESHGMDPARVLSWVRAMGKKLGPIRVVGCEPQELGDEQELRMGLSQPVQSAVEQAVFVVEELAESLTARRVYG